MTENATLLFLGTGTSMGVPTLGCSCAVCHSPDPLNNRMRASIAVQFNGKTVLIDTGPDFRTQALRFGITAVDAVLYTHGHADHILGFDDLRPLTFGKSAPTPLYADDPTATIIERIFDYTFRKVDRYPTSARVDLHRLSTEPGTTLPLFDASFERIPVLHGRNTIAGYRFGSAAYLTDMSDIPEASFERLRNLDILVLDALRREPHPSHSHLEKSIAIARRIGARHTYFTHLSHDLEHHAITEELPPDIHLAYDGLTLNFNITAGHDGSNDSNKSSDSTMHVYRSLAELPVEFGPSIVTIGNFDGVHFGHQTVIHEVVARAHKRNAKSVLVTLDPHPAKVLRPDKAPKLITPLAMKLELLATTGLDAVLLLPFTEEFSRTSPRDFCEGILRDALGALEVHEGENFRFGYGAEADMHSLESLGAGCGFTAHTFAPLQAGRVAISSSRIRKEVAAGSMTAARHQLGRPFSIDSTPRRDRGYGTQYTVPTINLAPYDELLPANGVYITTLRVGAGPQAITFQGVTNIGNRPTFGADSFAVETYLLNFRPIDLTETTPLRITFLHRLRDERKFPTPEDLKAQILRDVGRANRYHHLRRLLAADQNQARPALTQRDV